MGLSSEARVNGLRTETLFETASTSRIYFLDKSASCCLSCAATFGTALRSGGWLVGSLGPKSNSHILHRPLYGCEHVFLHGTFLHDLRLIGVTGVPLVLVLGHFGIRPVVCKIFFGIIV